MLPQRATGQLAAGHHDSVVWRQRRHAGGRVVAVHARTGRRGDAWPPRPDREPHCPHGQARAIGATAAMCDTRSRSTGIPITNESRFKVILFSQHGYIYRLINQNLLCMWKPMSSNVQWKTVIFSKNENRIFSNSFCLNVYIYFCKKGTLIYLKYKWYIPCSRPQTSGRTWWWTEGQPDARWRH